MKSNHVFPIPFPIPLAGLALAELMEGTVSTSPMPEVRQVIFNPPATAEPGKPTQPRRIGLDELLRLFVNDAPAGKIEATIVLG